MKVLLTGAAGFIGFHVAQRLLAQGARVLGLDDLNDYYSVALKRDRLRLLEAQERFQFRQLDIASHRSLESIVAYAADVDIVLHFAAQAGVRYSLQNPFAYVDSNVRGQVVVFEAAARLTRRAPVVYASSSSVYGADEAVPFTETARADRPVSIYAATKRAGELLAHAYADLHGIRSTGLRLFTVYGRYGRPDMAPWLFTDAILNGRPIPVFNNGEMLRDFTHVDDIVDGVMAAAKRILERPGETEPIYNLGHNSPVMLLDFIAAIEKAAGCRAIMDMRPKPAGDVVRTCADIALAERDLGFRPGTSLDDGIADFVGWFKTYSARSGGHR